MQFRRDYLPVLATAAVLSIGLGGLGCTPLGGWLYSDPTFSLSGVSTRYRGSPADTLQVTLTACNLNDFNIDGLTVEGHLLVDGNPVGSLKSDKAFLMKMRDSVDVAIPLEIPHAGEPPVHAKGDDYLSAKYELTGNIHVSTPIGVRRVRLQQRGDVRFDSAGIPSGWTVRNARPCKPGQSMLPGQGVKPRVIMDTMFRAPTPTPGVGGGRDGI